jgi:hypothetical protein
MLRLTVLSALLTCGLVAASAGAAAAQTAAAPSPGAVSVGASFDALNHYVFRGVLQNATKVAMWPAIEIGIRPYRGDGALKSVGLTAEFWNSLHTGDTGRDGPQGKLWYETRASVGIELQLGGGLSVTSAYQAFVSPSEMFDTVKEVSFAARFDDRDALGRAAVRPYAMLAFEIDAQQGEGQLDGGQQGGTYLELGARPAVAAGRVELSFPVRIGMSLDDYYEMAGTDHAFGFLSFGSAASIPIGGSAPGAAWSVRAAVEHHVLGDTPKLFNRGEGSRTVASAGIVWSR